MGEVVKVNSGKDYKHLNSGSIPVYGTGGYMLSVDESLSEVDAIGIGRKGTIDKPQFLVAPFWTVDTLFFMTPLQDNILSFLYSLSQNIGWEKMDESTGVPSLSKLNIENVDAHIPAATEQTAVGNFFRTLDDTITLYQRKLDKLKELKRGYLQQMFPQAGEKVPRVRFAGFTEPWQERRLGEVVERVQGNDGRMDIPTLTISAGNGWLDQKERFLNNIAGKEQANYTLLSRGELSYNKGNSKLAKYGVVFELQTYEEALVPRIYHSFKSTHESNASFLEYMFASKILDIELSKRITSGARMDGLLNIGLDSFMGIKINIPSVFEQTAIGDFLRNLDQIILVLYKKVNQLKQLKSVYLQKMFI